ncbi:MalY/PatB family protein [uncultured Roseobacter sp.]|uniref:MalY/PatB family protein n=1 Tax=uncultured Roseobacter sp. TaxID=114847 RepID=UPI00260DA0D5|nr:MalY/PatB family protein [uncultured Roseobacter sp.]
MSLDTPWDDRFDPLIDRCGTDCAKWDSMQGIYGVDPQDGIAMWVADMDFRPPEVVQDALRDMLAHGVYGYYGNQDSYHAAITWWMQERHGWQVEPDWIFSTHGLVNGTGMCIDAFTEPGDGIVLFTPVYHAFARVIDAAERKVVECPLVQVDGRYEMDFDAYDAQMTGSERMVILCSPHNPGGRVWSRSELEAVAAFCQRHDLVLVSDEIHHDLVMPGHTHTPMAKIDGVADRLVMMTATSKTFNLAGHHTGNVIIADPQLRTRFAQRMAGLGMSANSFGLVMARAAYSPAGAEWLEGLIGYLDGNRRLFDEAVNAIPGLQSMELESTYLAWVDFAGTGMTREEVTRRIQQDAGIAANLGTTFGSGGESFMRFNLGTPRARVQEACERLARAFGDLQ